MTTINDTAATVPSTPRLRWKDAGPVEETVWPRDVRAADVAFAQIAASAISTLVEDGGDRLRLCGAHGCNRMFVADHRRRRWCSRACGDRVRVARHYRNGKAD
jgi:predicted RNA-binding Zn ribbon-like protein